MKTMHVGPPVSVSGMTAEYGMEIYINLVCVSNITYLLYIKNVKIGFDFSLEHSFVLTASKTICKINIYITVFITNYFQFWLISRS